MLNEGMFIIDPETEEERWISYDELDDDVLLSLFKPIGGFCYPANQFAQLDLPKTPFYIADWLPKHGKAEIYAQDKAGKSYLALQMARCIASGEPFLGQDTSQGRVLYLQFEMGTQLLKDRILNTSRDYDGVYVGTSFSMKLDDASGQKVLVTAMESVLPNVLILDPLYKILSGDENEVQDMKKLTDFLDSIIEAYGDQDLSIVIMHHAGKDLARGGRGTSLLAGWVDSLIEMQKTSIEPFEIKLTPKSLRHAALPPEPVKAVMEDFEFIISTETHQSVKDKVTAWIKSAGEKFTSSDIHGAGLGARASVQKAINELCEMGVIKREQRGVYVCPSGEAVPEPV